MPDHPELVVFCFWFLVSLESILLLLKVIELFCQTTASRMERLRTLIVSHWSRAVAFHPPVQSSCWTNEPWLDGKTWCTSCQTYCCNFGLETLANDEITRRGQQMHFRFLNFDLVSTKSKDLNILTVMDQTDPNGSCPVLALPTILNASACRMVTSPQPTPMWRHRRTLSTPGPGEIYDGRWAPHFWRWKSFLVGEMKKNERK